MLHLAMYVSAEKVADTIIKRIVTTYALALYI